MQYFSLVNMVILLAVFNLTACKKLHQSALNAIVSSDHAFTLVPTRVLISKNQTDSADKAPVSSMLSQLMTMTAVSCTGAQAKLDIKIFENYLLTSGQSLRRLGTKIYTAGNNNLFQVANCNVSGEFAAGPASIAKLFDSAPNLALQALYLGLRGPTSLNNQTVGPVFYEFLTENYGLQFPNIGAYTAASKNLDTLFNPCIQDADSRYDKFAKFSCDTDGNYKVADQDYAGVESAVTSLVSQAEKSHMDSLRAQFATAVKVYEKAVSASDLTLSPDDSWVKQGVGAVFSPQRDVVAAALRATLVNTTPGFNIGTSAIPGPNPNDGTSGWRTLPNGTITKDEISFYSKDSSGKWTRTVVTQSFNVLTPISGAAAKFRFGVTVPAAGLVKEDGFGLSGKSESSEGTSQLPVNPNGREQWIAEQAPKMQQIVDGYRNGTVSPNDFRSQLKSVTKYMPYGQSKAKQLSDLSDPGDVANVSQRIDAKQITVDDAMNELAKKGGYNLTLIPQDPGSNSYNDCADIAANVCKSMYPILPQGMSVGRFGIQDGDGSKAHSINYFSFDANGATRFVAYDQQTGAISNPNQSIEATIKDPAFQSKVKNLGFENPKMMRIDDSTSNWVNGESSGITPYTPSNPQFANQLQFPSLSRYLRNGSGSPYADSWEWYKPTQVIDRTK